MHRCWIVYDMNRIRCTRCRSIFLRALLLLMEGDLRAQFATFTRTSGPQGARYSALGEAPDGTLFAGMAEGTIYRSSDHGDHWMYCKTGTLFAHITDFVFQQNRVVLAVAL